MKTITLASALITDTENRLLTVRKKNSAYFMMAGGKIEHGETPIQALIRELEEELLLTVSQNSIQYLGKHSTLAVNEPNTTVNAHIYHIKLTNQIVTNSAEIEELKWLTLDNYKEVQLARLLSEFSLPIWLDLFSKK